MVAHRVEILSVRVATPNYFYATAGSLIPAGNSPILLFVSRSFTDTTFQYTRPPVRLLQWQTRRFFFKFQPSPRSLRDRVEFMAFLNKEEPKLFARNCRATRLIDWLSVSVSR